MPHADEHHHPLADVGDPKTGDVPKTPKTPKTPGTSDTSGATDLPDTDPNYGLEPPEELPTPPSGMPAVTPHPLDHYRSAAFLMGSEPAFERAEPFEQPTLYPFQIEPDEPGMETRFLQRDAAAAFDRVEAEDHSTSKAVAIARASEVAAREAAREAAERAAANALSASPVVALSPTRAAERSHRKRPVRHSHQLHEYIPALTGLRTLATLAVCFYFVAHWTGHFRISYLGGVFDKIGSLGVSIFFILTGFLLFRQWLIPLVERDREPALQSRKVGEYFWKRFRRLVPPYWTTVILVYGLYWISMRVNGTTWLQEATETTRQVGTEPIDFLRNLTFTQSYGLGYYHPSFTQSWAITVTFAFYLLFPLIVWGSTALVNRKRFHALGTILYLIPFFLITPIWDIATRNLLLVDYSSRTWMPGFLSWFIAGMIMAVLSVRVPKYRESLITVSSLLLSVVAFIWYAAINLVGDPTALPAGFSDTFGRWVFGMLVACGLIVPLVFGDPHGDKLTSALHRFLGSRPMVLFGRISYEFFLLQSLIIEFIMWALGYRMFSGSLLLVFLLTLLVTTPLAWLLHIGTRWATGQQPLQKRFQTLSRGVKRTKRN